MGAQRIIIKGFRSMLFIGSKDTDKHFVADLIALGDTHFN